VAESCGACETCVPARRSAVANPASELPATAKNSAPSTSPMPGQAGDDRELAVEPLLAQVRVGGREGGPVRLGLPAPSDFRPWECQRPRASSATSMTKYHVGWNDGFSDFAEINQLVCQHRDRGFDSAVARRWDRQPRPSQHCALFTSSAG